MIEIIKPGALNQVPETFNYQSPLGFQFSIKRLPEVNYFVQKVNIPGLAVPPADEPSPYFEIPKPGGHVQFEPLVLTFKIDKGLNNYIELYDWLRATTAGSHYADLAKHPEYTGDGVESEILLSILDGQKNPIVEIIYDDAFPINLSGLNFDSTSIDVDYLLATCTFRFSQYHFRSSP